MIHHWTKANCCRIMHDLVIWGTTTSPYPMGSASELRESRAEKTRHEGILSPRLKIRFENVWKCRNPTFLRRNPTFLRVDSDIFTLHTFSKQFVFRSYISKVKIALPIKKGSCLGFLTFLFGSPRCRLKSRLSGENLKMTWKDKQAQQHEIPDIIVDTSTHKKYERGRFLGKVSKVFFCKFPFWKIIFPGFWVRFKLMAPVLKANLTFI